MRRSSKRLLDSISSRARDTPRLAAGSFTIFLAALELAVSHNRWHVMRQVGRMLDADAPRGLADRLLIEASLDSEIFDKLLTIERIIHWPRNQWHQAIVIALNGYDAA